jgi:hypothetical protein
MKRKAESSSAAQAVQYSTTYAPTSFVTSRNMRWR